jgi:DNA ligase D-like protein (predicted ligase)
VGGGKKRAPGLLKLEPPIGQFFTLIKPMEPQARREPFDSPGHFFQLKWDGVRILAFKDGSSIMLQNRKGRPRTEQYPELQRLAALVRAEDALLDGEVVVMEHGRPSFARVIQRDFCRREGAIKALARVSSVTYCLFDLLYLAGEDLTRRPLEERLRLLGEAVEAAPPVYLNENFYDGVALYRRLEELGLEGIVAKEKSSPYLIGQKSAYWQKIKPRRRQLCVAGGLTVKGGAVGALLLGAYRDGDLLYIGRAGSGLSRRDLLLLQKLAAAHRVQEPPFLNPPRGAEYVWLEPRLTVLIEYAEWTGDLRLRAPVVAGFSDRPPEEARL